MRKMKSKNLKRIALSLATVVTLGTFSAIPTLAAENVNNASESKQTINKNVDSKLVCDETEQVSYSDLSTLSEVGLYAGTETWYGGSALAGDYTFENNNLTPVKTMGQSGTLRISGSFYGADGYASASPIKLTVEIRSTSGAVLARTIATDDRTGSTPFGLSCNVTQGQRIQIFFDASSIANPPGIYRSAHVTYYRDLY